VVIYKEEDFSNDWEEKILDGYRPFNNKKEFISYWRAKGNSPEAEHPIIWLKSPMSNSIQLVIEFCETGLTIGRDNYDWEEILRYYKFLDDTPCGVKK
jgi:hypothetical protein